MRRCRRGIGRARSELVTRPPNVTPSLSTNVTVPLMKMPWEDHAAIQEATTALTLTRSRCRRGHQGEESSPRSTPPASAHSVRFVSSVKRPSNGRHQRLAWSDRHWHPAPVDQSASVVRDRTRVRRFPCAMTSTATMVGQQRRVASTATMVGHRHREGAGCPTASSPPERRSVNTQGL